MTFKITTIVTEKGLGKITYTFEQQFPKDSNVFGRVLAFRNYMKERFPGCTYRLIDTVQVN